MSRGATQPLLSDVARVAGVSPITVSRVVNGHPSVSEATRRRVLAAIDQVGYRANVAARTLAGGRSRIIGVAASGTAFYGPMRTLVAIEAAARAAEHSVTFVTFQRPERADLLEALDRLRQSHVDGAIVIAPFTDMEGALQSVPNDVRLVVTAGEDPEHAAAAIDQVHGARLATAHLLDLGHETVHHIGGPSGWHDATARAAGWRKELRSRGRTAPTPLRGDWSAESGYRIGRRLAQDPSMTAVFTANDEMALGLIAALAESGRRVPDDVSVVGFDDQPEASYFNPPLTTVRQDLDELGRRSVALMLELLSGEEPASVFLEAELVVRGSTRPRQ